ncbi:hypothetical protein H6P81_021235 [Aristolochia fimbriata]|uniref:Uncharacterized protein n=1 Tax=Aristolochia fimbriata TaxID=158543 RepID=A0AAV7DQH4_ARIFI|nr:hypothetical protein H6P81_021235 [Aristolochia fimbriata]
MYSTKSIALADRPGNLQNFIADGDRSLQLLVFNEEFLRKEKSNKVSRGEPAEGSLSIPLNEAPPSLTKVHTMPRGRRALAGCVNARQSPRPSLRDRAPTESRRTIEVFERKLHPRPLGQGYTCPGATPDAAPPHPAPLLPHRWGGGRVAGAQQIGRPCPGRRLAENTLPQGHFARRKWWLRPPAPARAQVAVRGPGSRGTPAGSCLRGPEALLGLAPQVREADGAGLARARSERGRESRSAADSGADRRWSRGRPKPGRMIPPAGYAALADRGGWRATHGRVLAGTWRAPWRRASGLPIQPALKHGPRSPTCVRSQRATKTPGCTADPPRSSEKGSSVSIPAGTPKMVNYARRAAEETSGGGPQRYRRGKSLA